jgi:predicted TIM-barrel fold metal-dependent hydrolase
MNWPRIIALIGPLAWGTGVAWSQPVKTTPAYRRIRAAIDAVPAIDTHDHLWPFDRLPGLMETDRGRGMTLYGLWRASYFPQVHPPTPRRPREPFGTWWDRARHDFDDARATGFYRYQLAAFRDLYGVDLDRITDAQAADLDARIFANYRDESWVRHVVTERAKIELMLNDPYWGRLEFATHYPFEVLVFNVTTLLDGFHRSEFKQPADDPYRFAEAHGLRVESLDDYLAVLDRLFRFANEKGAVCLKTTRAYQRTLRFEDVPRDRAARIFGRPRAELSPQEVAAFQDFIMWRLVELSARYDLPFQIHTGHGRLQGSNPQLLLDLIESNPRTKFILFHGGYPWVGETGAIVLRHGSHVWVDSVWLPTISPTMARRALHEWLEVMPSDRLMWGADCNHAEGIYGATMTTRLVLAEVLAEKVERGELLEEHALRIGRQVLRDNALKLFPQLRGRLRERTERPADGDRRPTAAQAGAR